jgi:hypothetical protein
MEYRRRQTNSFRNTFQNLRRILRVVPSHTGAQNVSKYELEKMMILMQDREPTYMCAQNLHEVGYCIDTVVGDS